MRRAAAAIGVMAGWLAWRRIGAAMAKHVISWLYSASLSWRCWLASARQRLENTSFQLAHFVYFIAYRLAIEIRLAVA
jgi:hypothetical protein